MAKSNDNTAPENTSEPPVAGPSQLIIEALASHAEQQGLVQGEGEEEIAFAVRCIQTLGGIIIGMDESIQVLEAERNGLREDVKALNRRLASQRGATTKAKAKIEEMVEAAKPRALGPLADVLDPDAPLFDVNDLMTAIDSAEEIVLAFSDGRAELQGIKPRAVNAEAFKLAMGRIMLAIDVLELTGPTRDDGAPTHLAGVALLLDGEQAAWSPMAQPIEMGAGQTFNIAGSVVFG